MNKECATCGADVAISDEYYRPNNQVFCNAGCFSLMHMNNKQFRVKARRKSISKNLKYIMDFKEGTG